MDLLNICSDIGGLPDDSVRDDAGYPEYRDAGGGAQQRRPNCNEAPAELVRQMARDEGGDKSAEKKQTLNDVGVDFLLVDPLFWRKNTHFTSSLHLK